MAFDGLLDNVSSAISNAENIILGYEEDCGLLIHEYRHAIEDWRQEETHNNLNPTDQIDSGFLDDLFEELQARFENAQRDIEDNLGDYGVEWGEIQRELDYAGKEAFDDVHLGDVYDQWVDNR